MTALDKGKIRKILFHGAFWLTLWGILVALDWHSGDYTPLFVLKIEGINILFYALIYYVNSLYLIPKYLTINKLGHYLLFLLGSALVFTPIKIFLLFQQFRAYPSSQEYLQDNQYYYYLISLIAAGVSTMVKIVSDWVRQTQTQRELETRTMQTELNFLKSQINPHFLFNTLNSLYALTLKKSEEAPEVVIKLSEMMRYMLYECNEPQVSLGKEIQYLRNYLDLERLRHKDLETHFDIEGDAQHKTVAPLIFLAFIENAFKHGAANHISTGYVHIGLHIEDNELNLYVENSKPERQPAQTHKRSGGIGLVNVRRRLEILYPKKHHLDIYDNPTTYAVNLWMELTPSVGTTKTPVEATTH